MKTVKYDITLMVPLLHFTSNITLTAAIESVFGHGRVGGTGQLHFQRKEATYLNGKFSRHQKSAIDSYYWRHYIENNIGLTCPYF